MRSIEDAIQLACFLHEGQLDKGGNPYILHPIRVMLKMKTEDEQIVALLHDIVEDTPVTFDDLRRSGYSEEILNAIDALTRRDGESYMDFIRRAKENRIAREVKIQDLYDNLDMSRLNYNWTDDDIKRCKKYHKALRVLKEE